MLLLKSAAMDSRILTFAFKDERTTYREAISVPAKK